MAIKSYRDLRVWQRAMDLTTECYCVSQTFPDHERFGLTSQLRRAAASIPANIAEGNGRGSRQAYVNHLWIANGSLRELETHLELAERLGYLARGDAVTLLNDAADIGRLLIGLRRSLSAS